MEPNEIYHKVEHLGGSINILYDKIAYVDKLAKARADHLEDLIQSEIKRMEKEFDRLEEDLMEIKNNLEVLMQEIKNSFKEFNHLLENLRSDTIKSAEKISTELEKVEETSRTGFLRISSGVAIVDILKALTDVKQIEIAIERSLNEIDNRYKQAKDAMQIKRNEFDKHFEQIEKGFEKQMQVIGQHIFDMGHLFHLLNELRINEDMVNTMDRIIWETQKKVTSHRTKTLEERKCKIDFDRLTEFKILRAKLNQFLSDQTALRLEEPATEAGTEEIPPLGIPINIVKLAKNEFSPSGTNNLQVFCLNAKGKDCYTKPEPAIEFSGLTKAIRELCEQFGLEHGVDVSKNIKEGIKSGLKKLMSRGLLRKEHSELIEQHLDLYPLLWMES